MTDIPDVNSLDVTSLVEDEYDGDVSALLSSAFGSSVKVNDAEDQQHLPCSFCSTNPADTLMNDYELVLHEGSTFAVACARCAFEAFYAMKHGLAFYGEMVHTDRGDLEYPAEVRCPGCNNVTSTVYLGGGGPAQPTWYCGRCAKTLALAHRYFEDQ